MTPAGRFWRKPGSVTFRRATATHRLELPRVKPSSVGKTEFVVQGFRSSGCWSLFLTGPKIRTWGFHCPKGFVPWYDFVARDNAGEVGPGCGE